jgi:hypothetical protein
MSETKTSANVAVLEEPTVPHGPLRRGSGERVDRQQGKRTPKGRLTLSPDLEAAAKAALFAALNAKPKSDEAHRLVTSLVDEVSSWEVETSSRKYAGQVRREKLRTAVTGFVADLLDAATEPISKGFAFRPMSAVSFTGQPVSHRTPHGRLE